MLLYVLQLLILWLESGLGEHTQASTYNEYMDLRKLRWLFLFDINMWFHMRLSLRNYFYKIFITKKIYFDRAEDN